MCTLPLNWFHLFICCFPLYLDSDLEIACKRKLWSQESMKAAVQSVAEGRGLREASWLYNVPVEMLRRCVTGKVDIDCRPGSPTVLTESEEKENI